MDVRCEKCQTEYELDESRLKPGGVTVKCTNCGHMFKIRKRTTTNVGLPAVADAARAAIPRREPRAPPTRSPSDDHRRTLADSPTDPNAERQHWMIRLENGEQKTCRELATLQQWIVAGIVTRESLISRSGKTWKRLGDIAELGQYFAIADEARAQARRRSRPASAKEPQRRRCSASAARRRRGTIVRRRRRGARDGNFEGAPDRQLPRAPGSRRRRRRRPARAERRSAPTEVTTRRPVSQPPRRPPTGHSVAAALAGPGASPPVPAGNRRPRRGRRATAQADRVPDGRDAAGSARRQALRDPENEPAFAGRVRDRRRATRRRSTPARCARSTTTTTCCRPQRGSRAGMWIALLALLVIGGAAGAVYMFVFNEEAGGRAGGQAAGRCRRGRDRVADAAVAGAHRR